MAEQVSPARFRLNAICLAVAGACAALSAGNAMAFQIDTGNPDLRISWDNTIKYSAAWRVGNRDSGVANDSLGVQMNTNDGDRNFSRGLISNRLDLLSELDVRYKRNYGLRLSAAAWYDDVYNQSNDNPGSFSPLGGGNQLNSKTSRENRFSKDTRDLHGRKAELLDAFVYGRYDIGNMALNLRAGRFTQLYGESLFFGNNGIAGAQTSLDLIKALSVPNSQFKEIMRPTGQVTAQLQINQNVSVGAYYQLEWRKSRIPAAGSYFSFADFVDEGGDYLYVPGVGDGRLRRAGDIDAKNSGQGGVQVKIKSGEFEYGIYAAQYHDKMPQFYVYTDTARYEQVFAENIRTLGFSVSTLIGETNVAAELSYRHGMPLVASGTAVISMEGLGPNGAGRAAYPKGNTLHFNLSAISLFNEGPFWDGASFIGEFAFNRRLSITNKGDMHRHSMGSVAPGAGLESRLDAEATRDAGAIQFIFTPEYFQVMPGLDLQVPIGMSYGLFGRSSVNGVLMPSHKGGNFSVGLKAEYMKKVQASLNFTHYYGSSGSIVKYDTAVPELSYKNFHGDRDFISFSIQRTF